MNAAIRILSNFSRILAFIACDKKRRDRDKKKTSLYDKQQMPPQLLPPCFPVSSHFTNALEKDGRTGRQTGGQTYGPTEGQIYFYFSDLTHDRVI